MFKVIRPRYQLVNVLYWFLATYFSLQLFSAPDAGSLLNLEKEMQQNKVLPQVIPKSILSDMTVDRDVDKSGEKIYVKKFEFSGDTWFLNSKTLNKLTTEFENKELTFGQIQSFATKIRMHYVSKGFFLSNAIIPKQEVEEGVVLIKINAGSLDSNNPYSLKNEDLRIKSKIPVQYLQKAIGNKLTKSRVERGILNLNQTPGIIGYVNLQPGDDPGSTKVELDVKESRLIEGLLTVDNHGSRYTGENRISGSVYINNPSKYGDQVSLTKVLSFEDNFDLNMVGYNFPLGRTGLRANATYSSLEYQIGKELETNPISMGTADSYSLGLSYPIYHTSKRSIFWNGSYIANYLYNENLGIVVSDKEVANQQVGLTIQNTDTFFKSGFTQISFNQTFGDLDLEKVANNYAADQGAGGAKTSGKFEKLSAQIFRIQKVTDKLNLQLLASSQFVSKNVDSSEDFSLGGPAGVRAYPSGEASGDEGFKVSVDVQYNLSSRSKFGDLILSTFYDYGEIKQFKETYDIIMSTPNEYSLEGWGVSLDLVTLERLNVKVIWADSIGENPGKTVSGMDSDGLNKSSRVWALARISF